MPSSRAICLLVWPRHTRLATSAERGGSFSLSACADSSTGVTRGTMVELVSPPAEVAPITVEEVVGHVLAVDQTGPEAVQQVKTHGGRARQFAKRRAAGDADG